MITQEIKLNDEPVVTVYKPPVTVQPANNAYFKRKYSDLEIQLEREKAFKNGIKYGTKWRYPHSQVGIEVKGFNISPLDMETINGNPAIIRGERISLLDNKNLVFNYTVEEILEMEQIYD